ncbi:carboxylesterase/lipase family protein [Umezawaea endophytica]|uniref:Carboxylic ester hydrolase n=1 Tax=Umezawaea endophytica TaxID=1654476 RepID=A0A9X3AFL7_9PSEU|nr:carboxylesterase family protein [Umezawaea endophytica]MCS7478471.1 carboxylesterase family protein [Umezawaea endophytica]
MTTVRTTTGAVRGKRGEHGTVFLGVPYAAPPVGALRFAAPRPHEPWTGVRDATRHGPTAPQPVRGGFAGLDLSPYFAPGWREGDDHLVLNVHAPDTQGAPVVVFVHGGGFVAGSASADLYDGTAFARDGVVLVTVEYRLGLHGFLHLPDEPDNRGALDVLAALRWVRDNIERFGGDPTAVTLAGQSAGATIVAGVLATPESDGLVRRAVVQSGSGTGAFTTEQALIVTRAVGRELGLDPTAAALAEVPDQRLVDVIPKLAGLDLRTATHHDPLGGITAFGLVLDRQPADALRGGVDLLIGTNLDEGSLYLRPDEDVPAIAARFALRPDDLALAERPHGSEWERRSAVLGMGLFGAGTRRLADANAATGTPTFVYEFTWRSDALGGGFGAGHVVELPFVFDRLDLPSLHGPNALLGTTAPPADLAARTHRAWVDFATTGDPGWPRSEPGRRVVRRIGSTWDLVDDRG